MAALGAEFASEDADYQGILETARAPLCWRMQVDLRGLPFDSGTLGEECLNEVAIRDVLRT